MSRPLCETCGSPIHPSDAAVCKTCERFFCQECLPEHTCAIEAKRELFHRSKNFNLRRTA